MSATEFQEQAALFEWAALSEGKIVIISSEWLLTSDLLGIDEGTFSRVYEKTKGFRVEVKREAGRNHRMGGET